MAGKSNGEKFLGSAGNVKNVKKNVKRHGKPSRDDGMK